LKLEDANIDLDMEMKINTDIDMGSEFEAELELMAESEEENNLKLERKANGRRLRANAIQSEETVASNSISDIASVLYGSPDFAI